MSNTKKNLWHIFWLTLAVPLAAFAAQQLWGWFVVPITGLPQLSLLAAMGLHLTVKYFTQNYSLPVEREHAENIRIAMYVVGPIISLIVGWIIHSCM